jgi:putative flippase GtrA
MRQLDGQMIDWVQRFVLHVVTGFLAVFAHYGVMALLLKAGYTPVLASSSGFVFGALTRFLTAYFHVFSPKNSVSQTLPKFILSLALQAVLNFLLLKGFIELSIPVWWSQILTTGTLTVLNYIVYRVWVFV